MKKNINPIIKTLISIFLLLSLSSCENIFSKLEPLESANSNSSDKAYIKINVVQESSERTIIPTIDLSLLSSISLRGRKADNNNVTDANLLSGSTWEAFSSQTLSIDPGEWEFNLSASLNINSNGATTLRGTKTVTLQQGETTTLNFTLAPSSSSTTTKGGLYVKVNFEDPSKKVTKVVATLMDEAKENIQGDPQSITGTSIKSPTGSPRYIEYKISNSSTYGIEQGTYFLTLEFFAGSDSAGWVSLNTISSYVRINAYYTSAATFDLDLNELYTITYKYYLLDEELSSNTGISIAADSPSTILPTAFSRRSAITLPTLTYSDTTYQFAGWYETSDFSGTPVTGIARGSFGNKTLYARFISSTLYVSQTGNDTNDGITVSTALATVTKAVEQIISYGNIAADYTIKISGTITGGVNIASTLTTEMASSLTLEGETGKSGDDWVDVLDGGFTSSSKGTTLAINTAVPVTLKNLKITGGYQGGGSGAGIKLAGDSTLVMESGEISGNTGNDSGQASAAGVYISHGGTANFGATQIAGAKFTMNGGSICNNTGTGVTLYDGSNPGEFNMYGGTIIGNTAYGVNLVYSTGPFGKFTMKGSATITSDNKVRLGHPGNTKIYIADALTGTAPVATITLNGYNENTEVVALANGVTDTSHLSAACAKIEVAPYNGIPWYLTSDGKITSTNPNGGNSGGNSSANILDGFVLVTGGRVDFAITDSDPFGEADKNAVFIQDLYVCKHEVTQAEYETYCTYGCTDYEDNLLTPEQTTNKDKYPVYYVNWYDAIIYCNLRSLADTLNPVYSINGSKDPATWPGIRQTNNKFYGPTSDHSYQWDYYTGSYVSGIPPQDSVSADFSADGYRLPTVAEWEYIARGGNSLSDETIRNYTYSGGNSLSSIGYSDNQVHEIKSKDPNTLDIYDMSNSIGEWCYGWTGFEADYRPAKDYNAEVKSSYSELSPSEGKSYLGFRVVRSAKVKAFSVSANKQITFSPANMEVSFETYTYSGGSSTTTNWIFANHQYDIVGSDNSKIGTDDQTIDLMGWGTSNYSNCTITSSSTTASYGPDGEVNLTGEGNEKYDWGIFNSFENGGKDSYMWRTLSKDEWNYLLNSRTNASSKYGVAQVNDVNGLILLPDEWEIPDSLTFNSGTAATGGTYASKNSYTAAQWKQMEINGAIFLPAAGSRTETTVTGVGETGEYWTTTADGSTGAYYITFTAESVSVSEASNENNHRYVGRAVRLVHEITTSN